MLDTSLRTELTFYAKPPLKRIGLIPFAVALIIGVVLSMMWLVVAIFVFFHNHLIGLILGLTAFSYASYAFLISYGLIQDMNYSFRLELTPSEIILTKYNTKKQKKYFKMLLIDDIKIGEYYPYSDSASIILYTSYTEMEIPLWPLNHNGQDVIDYLTGRGVKIVNVQFDDKLPD